MKGPEFPSEKSNGKEGPPREYKLEAVQGKGRHDPIEEEERIKEHLEKLTLIEEKTEKGEELTAEELRFLYHHVYGIGDINSKVDDDLSMRPRYGTGDRFFEIMRDRDFKEDLSSIFNCREDQISLRGEEAFSGDIVYHYGELFLKNGLTSAKNVKFPREVGASLYLLDLRSVEGLELPEKVRGIVYLNMRLPPEELEKIKEKRSDLRIELFYP